MGSLIKQECFKLSKKKSTWIWPIVIIAIMITLLFISQNSDIMSSEGLIQGGFSGFYWVVILMIVQASTIISMEFHYETIKNVLYRNYSRTSIVISKVITLVIYSLICFIGVIAVTLLLYAISFNDIDLLAPHGSQPPLLNEMLLLAVADFVTMWLVLSLTLLISCAMKGPTLSITIGIFFYFVISFVAALLTYFNGKWEWFKWNPLNMIMLPQQIVDNDFKEMSHLELHELFIGNIVYIVIFLVLLVFVFKKKNV